MCRSSARFLIGMVLLLLGGCHSENASNDQTVQSEGGAATNGDTKLAKRAGPSEVPAVTTGNLKIAPIHWGKRRGLDQNGGYIAAYDVATGKELWILKVYSVSYDASKESDVQDVFIESLTKTDGGDEIRVVDEEGRVYFVNPQTRVVRRP